MKFTVVWSENAYSDYEQIGEFLMWKWGLQSVRKFAEEVGFVITLLEKRPSSFQKSLLNPTFRKTLINKHTSVYFRIDGETVTLIAFWNHAQDPDNLQEHLKRD